MNPFFDRKFYKYFFISFAATIPVIILNFILHYHEDFFGKGIPAGYILQAIGWFILYTILSPVRVAVFAAPFIWFWKKSKQGNGKLFRSFVYGLPFVLAIAALCFIFDNTAGIKCKQKELILLYTAKQTWPPEYIFTKLLEENKNKFNDLGSPSSIKFNRLAELSDSLGINIQTYRNACDSLETLMPGSLVQMLPDCFAGELRQWMEQINPSDTLQMKQYYAVQEHKNNEQMLWQDKQLKIKYENEIHKRIWRVSSLLLLYFAGILFGSLLYKVIAKYKNKYR